MPAPAFSPSMPCTPITAARNPADVAARRGGRESWCCSAAMAPAKSTTLKSIKCGSQRRVHAPCDSVF